MMLLDGQALARTIKDEIKKEIVERKITPGLAVVLAGDSAASAIYVRNKKKACDYAGIKSFSFELPGATKEAELLDLINDLNLNEEINGILVQLPLPGHINEEKIIQAVAPEKDVDGFHPINVGKFYLGLPAVEPCTPAGVIEILKRNNIEIAGRHCVVVGRSNIVGKPMAQLLLRNNGTVTICHSKTENIAAITKQADILVAAVGKANFITADMVKKGSVVIDVGINRLDSGRLAGDVDFENVKKEAAYITPVPGGVGPMTIAMLLKNCLKTAEQKF